MNPGIQQVLGYSISRQYNHSYRRWLNLNIGLVFSPSSSQTTYRNDHILTMNMGVQNTQPMTISGRSYVWQGHSNLILSVVVPMYNERESIDRFFERIVNVVDELVQALNGNYEIVCVDDGSTDGTLERLLFHHDRNPKIKILSLSRNFGKEIALSAGLDHSSGAAVIPIDVDLQDPPEVIPQLFEKWLEGYEVVYATRQTRQSDSITKRLTSSWFYQVYNRLADTAIPHDTGDFRIMDRRVIAALRNLPERHRFMKGLFSWVGFRQTGIEFHRDSRAFGKTKWKYWRLWNFALDGITSNTTVPLRIWTYFGFAISMLAFGYAVFFNHSQPHDRH